MHVLFVHPNYPAQFRYLAPRLVTDLGWRCTFATRNTRNPDVPGVERIVYTLRGGALPTSHFCARGFQNEVAHAHGVYEALKARPDVKPDLVVAHSGFGSSLFLPQLYDAPVINFFEYFRRVRGACVGYRPELPLEEPEVLRCRTSNATILLDLENCDRGWCPNRAQRDAMPPEYHHKIEVIPEGVDTRLYSRTACGPPIGATEAGDIAAGYSGERWLPDGTRVEPGTRVVTYVSRGLELARGQGVKGTFAFFIVPKNVNVPFTPAGGEVLEEADKGPPRARNTHGRLAATSATRRTMRAASRPLGSWSGS